VLVSHFEALTYTPKEMRKIKIYGRFQRRETIKDGFVPHISLCGKWVEDAGFQLGKQVFVTVEAGKMIIQNEQNYAESTAAN
jgi:hypothetical protein